MFLSAKVYQIFAAYFLLETGKGKEKSMQLVAALGKQAFIRFSKTRFLFPGCGKCGWAIGKCALAAAHYSPASLSHSGFPDFSEAEMPVQYEKILQPTP